MVLCMKTSLFNSMQPLYKEAVAQHIFESCWSEICSHINTKYSDVLGRKKFFLMDDSDYQSFVDDVEFIIGKVLLLNNITDATYLTSLQKLFLELSAPLSKKHHEMACSMLTPNLMTFEMLSAFMESWIKVNFGELQHVTNPSFLIEKFIFNICYAVNIRFDVKILVLLHKHLLGQLDVLKTSKGKAHIQHYLYNAQTRIMLSDLMHSEDISSCIQGVCHSVMANFPMHIEAKQNNNPIVAEYINLSGKDVFNDCEMRSPLLFKAIKKALIYNPYNCLSFIGMVYKGVDLNKHNIPFGLCGLLGHGVLFNLVLRQKSNGKVFAYTICTLTSLNDTHNAIYGSCVYQNSCLGEYLPYLGRTDFTQYLLPKHLSVIGKLLGIEVLNIKSVVDILKTKESYIGENNNAFELVDIPSSQNELIAFESNFYMSDSTTLRS